MKLTGTIKTISDRQDFGTNGFYKRDLILVIDENSDYPQPICIKLHKEKGDNLNFAEGEQVEVSINLRGKEYQTPKGETKYFNSIVGWRIEKAGSPIPQNTQIPQEPLPGEDPDDLPY